MTDHDRPQGQRRDPDAVVTRYEEELRITTHPRETQRARLIKYVETETHAATAEVRRERVRVEYEPIAVDAPEAPSVAGSALSENRWLVLYEEEIIVQTRWVARERVRLATHTVIEQCEIFEDVRREQVAVDMTQPDGG